MSHRRQCGAGQKGKTEGEIFLSFHAKVQLQPRDSTGSHQMVAGDMRRSHQILSIFRYTANRISQCICYKTESIELALIPRFWSEQLEG